MSSIIANPLPSRAARWFALIKEAILGSKQDFTAISIDRAIVLLAVPMVLEMAMESLFGIVDIFFVAHLGADSTATVGITEGMLVLVMAVAFGLSMGTTAVVARRVGEHDQNGVAEAAVQSILIGVGFALLIFSVAFPLAPILLRWMGAGPGILHVGSLYSRIMLSSSGIILLLFLINAVFRGAGDAAVAMRVLWLANFINLCLDPCLIMGLGPFPRLGVTGAAVSTSIGRSIGIVFQLYMLSKGSAHLNILRKHIRLKLKLMWNIFEVAGIGVLQLLIATASWLAMVRIVQSFGSQATAGYTVAIRIVIFSTLPSWGLGSAAATLVGPARALLVRYQEVVTPWRREGMALPPRFPVAEQSTVLKAEAGGASGTHPVRVRGRIVGLLHWRAAAPPGTAPMAQLELMLEAAGLRLLALGLEEAEEPRESRAEVWAGGTQEEEQARGLARLLAEDLELYLRRERAAEVAEAQRVEDAWPRFQPEIERCRRGYRERYPEQAELGEMVFREMMERLQAG